ncbi:hypothetical protein OEV98_06270 [Caldibacillus lycopersici]|uniref:Uncharacterized protein n=1 Tax=Perspicuibacillus lycopersici TaxID=1325689 RepID=A0AAE3IRK4_9BACI|nr:hypothetical protein [Perspicuibacillus lycopersici]MCU9613156.1 hypothetical protein [Perspicuibacillus lycopersici]
MTEITFLAHSRPFQIPKEIEDYNNRMVFEREEDAISFTVQEIDDYWKDKIAGLFTMPYVYEAHGVGNQLFLTYIEKHMELGDVLEIFHVPNQHAFEEYRQKLEEHPEPIEINVRNHTYQTIYGMYQLQHKNWLDELSHRNYHTPYGVTTFVNY